VCVSECSRCSVGHCNVVSWMSYQLCQMASAYDGATGSIWCFTNRKVIPRSCQHPSTSITQTHKNTHRSATQPFAHTHKDTDTLGIATHKAVNNRKWYVAEKVSAQLDSPNMLCFSTTSLFSLSMLICLQSPLLG